MAPGSIRRWQIARTITTSELIMTCNVMMGAVTTASVVSMAGLALAMLVPGVLGMVFLRKTMPGRALGFSVFAVLLWSAEAWWLAGLQPQIATNLAVQQLNGGDAAAMDVRTFEALKAATHNFAGLVLV